MHNSNFIMRDPPGVKTKHSNEHAEIGERLGLLDGPKCCVFVFCRQVAFDTYIDSYKTEAAVEPFAFLEFHGCVVVLECREDAP